MTNTSIHRLVAEAFIPNPNKKPDINHINGIKTDNHVENLEWCTESENTQHAITNRLIPLGESSVKSKLKEVDVIKILSLSKTMTHASIANIFGVSRRTIGFICQGKNWKYIPRNQKQTP